MTRRARRDPRSLLELRRLALRVRRNPDAREVLHDALLETFPREYEAWIRAAQQRAKKFKNDEFAVVFYPSRLKRRMLFDAGVLRRRLLPESLFNLTDNPIKKMIDTSTLEDEIHYWIQGEPRSGVVVYRTRGYL